VKPVRKILYLQHAQGLGGSCVSLQCTIQALDRSRFHPVVALTRPTPEVERYHAEAGIETLAWPGIGALEHTTGGYTSLGHPFSWPAAARTIAGWRRSEQRTLELVDRVRPDLVHLNSAVLYPSARALHRARRPFVWHVRESQAPGLLGVRRAMQRRALVEWPAEVFFLSHSDRAAWVHGVRGLVVPDFADLSRFDPALDGGPVRRELGIPEDAKVVLYLGGWWSIKGILPLLQAMAQVRGREPRAVCLMPNMPPRPSPSPAQRLAERAARSVLPLLGQHTFGEQLEEALAALEPGALLMLGFADRVERLLAASDLLAFPAIENHFARPVFEAGAMERPVVASRLPILEEQVRDGETGLLVPPGDPTALAEAILALLSEPDRGRAMGRAGRRLALERHDDRRNIAAIMDAYDSVLSRQGQPA
jgi:glycosyltransferase involved in cell wall biosynthesis